VIQHTFGVNSPVDAERNGFLSPEMPSKVSKLGVKVRATMLQITSNSARPLGAATLQVFPSGTIEDARSSFEDSNIEILEADFANKYIGGGVLGHVW
jgi:hypothetical protein